MLQLHCILSSGFLLVTFVVYFLVYGDGLFATPAQSFSWKTPLLLIQYVRRYSEVISSISIRWSYRTVLIRNKEYNSYQ